MADDRWVVNASPLIALAHAGKLELLETVPNELVVPEAVVDEILAGPDDPARRALVSGWGVRRAATVPEKVAEWGLGKGESAVLALALDLDATAVLDDRSARRSAKALGVAVIGTFGIIIRAKKRRFRPRLPREHSPSRDRRPPRHANARAPREASRARTTWENMDRSTLDGSGE